MVGSPSANPGMRLASILEYQLRGMRPGVLQKLIKDATQWTTFRMFGFRNKEGGVHTGDATLE